MLSRNLLMLSKFSPRSLQTTVVQNDQETLSNLLAAHSEGKTNAGFDCEGEGTLVVDAKEKEIFDLYLTKFWALKYATSAANQILRVDQIIMAKKAGWSQGKRNGPPGS
ncbi:T-complex protein 1 subunit theta-like [Penaeus indicus]|uniref:T-complex protein 1 subunit theta-like n=1 Tax=Penaeus indicus TaxID=29960 RepID=UPI00300DB211